MRHPSSLAAVIGRAALLAAALAVRVAFAEPPATIHYQGRMTDEGGAPLDGEVDIVVAVYTQQTDGVAVWQQTTDNVAVVQGLYTFDFGGPAFDAILTNTACWLQLTIDGDQILTPRERLVAVPYARHAAFVYDLENPSPEGGGVPGMILMWAGTLDAIPAGWDLCDGQNGTPDLRNRFVVCASDTLAPGTTGGASSFNMTVAQMPSHSHSGTAESAGSHSHTASSGNAGNHSHSGSTSTAGNHSHAVWQRSSYGGYRDRCGGHNWNQYGGEDDFSTRNNPGNHGHSVTINANGNHTHSVTVNAGGSHSHSIAVNNAGSGAAIDNRPATMVLAYIMKR